MHAENNQLLVHGQMIILEEHIPDNYVSLYNCGLEFMAREDYESAAVCFRRAIELQPDARESRYNHAVCLWENHLFADAEREFRWIIQHCSEDDDARFAAACLALLRGDFVGGLPEYEVRLKLNHTQPQGDFSRPLWDGRSLDGATVLLHAEQSLGDCILAVRYVPLLARRGARVVLLVPHILQRLMQSLPGVYGVIAPGDSMPEFDCHVPLMSLPLQFATTVETIPAARRYFFPQASRKEQWHSKIPRDGTVKVGLVWRADRNGTPDQRNSCPFEAFAPLWCISGVTFISLQGESIFTNSEGDLPGAFYQLPGECADFADTAACMEHLDLIISVDTAYAHLAGALGRPVWLLLPFVAHWCWLQDRVDSPWYPSMRIFRQNNRGAWNQVLEQVAEALREIVLLQGDGATSVAGHAASAPCGDGSDINSALYQGAKLHDAERFAEALACYDELLRTHPDVGVVHHNRANTLMALGKYREAIAGYRRAVALIPAFAEGYATMATALQAIHKPHEAISCCYRALALDSTCAEAHWNLALALLQVGEFASGWQEFEWRWQKRGFTSRERTYPQPLWDGSHLTGKTILVHAEQGFGDCFQFARYLPLLAERGARVIVECPAPLQGVIATITGVAVVVAPGELIPPFDCHVPIMSLPLRFATTLDSIPACVPYLYPPDEAVARWAGKFSDHKEFRVGLVWAGRKKPDPNRTCPLQYLQPLAAISGVTFFSLQVENELSGSGVDRKAFPMVDYTAELADFSDTAALIAHLDLVISIDTGVAHLAGAMGKETWVMLPHAADWRWMLDRNDSPWYPSMRVFRQREPGDWFGVVARVGEALRYLVTVKGMKESP